MKKRYSFIILSVVISLIFWIFQSLVDISFMAYHLSWKNLFVPNTMAFWMRILWVCFAILTGVFAQTEFNKILGLENKGKRHISAIFIVYGSIGFGVFYWIIEAVRDVLILQKGSLLKRIFLPDSVALLERISAVLLFIFLGFYTYYMFERKRQEHEKTRELHNED